MISDETETLIRRLYCVEGWRIGTIARHLRIHRCVVERVLKKAGSVLPKRAKRPSKIEPFLPFIQECFEKYPGISAARLYRMVWDRGYRGSPDHFRHLVAPLKPKKPCEGYLRLRTLCGEQAQADWAHFGKARFGSSDRTLWGFIMVLSWSRGIFLRFYPGASGAYFFDGHVEAFSFWGGCPRVVLYDNLRTVVLERRGDAIRFHPDLLALAAHYGFEPRPVAVRRPNEKARVERAIRFVRGSFFLGREWKDLAELNRLAIEWCLGPAMERPWPEDRALSVKDAFEIEREKLLPLPPDAFPAAERKEVVVGKTPYVRFDSNDYSVPHTLVGKTLVVVASPSTVRILDGSEVVAEHPRSFEKGCVIEDPAHVEALAEEKKRARKERGQDRLARAVPSSQELLERLAERGDRLSSAVRQLIKLLDAYGHEQLESAIVECLKNDVPHPHAVRHVLEKRREAQGLDPALPLELPEALRAQDLAHPPARLESYDNLKEEDHATDDDDESASPVLA